jgi:hypothetical protein
MVSGLPEAEDWRLLGKHVPGIESYSAEYILIHKFVMPLRYDVHLPL